MLTVLSHLRFLHQSSDVSVQHGVSQKQVQRDHGVEVGPEGEEQDTGDMKWEMGRDSKQGGGGQITPR